MLYENRGSKGLTTPILPTPSAVLWLLIKADVVINACDYFMKICNLSLTSFATPSLSVYSFTRPLLQFSIAVKKFSRILKHSVLFRDKDYCITTSFYLVT